MITIFDNSIRKRSRKHKQPAVAMSIIPSRRFCVFRTTDGHAVQTASALPVFPIFFYKTRRGKTSRKSFHNQMLPSWCRYGFRRSVPKDLPVTSFTYGR